MNKTKFIERISQRTGFTKSQTEIVIEAALQTIKEEDNVSLRGFATFVKKVYPAKTFIIGTKHAIPLCAFAQFSNPQKPGMESPLNKRKERSL